ncbi:MAG: hypothetical protein WCI72_06795 [archaeon]
MVEEINEDYYAGNDSKKTLDYTLGFFSVVFLLFLMVFILSLNINITSELQLAIAILVPLTLNIIFGMWMFKIKRRYVAIGIISFYAILLLLYGACFTLLSGI